MLCEILDQVSVGLHHNCQIDDWMSQEAARRTPPKLARDWLKKKQEKKKENPQTPWLTFQTIHVVRNGKPGPSCSTSVLRGRPGMANEEFPPILYFTAKITAPPAPEHSSTRVVSKGILLASSPRRSNPGLNAFRVVFDSRRVPSLPESHPLECGSRRTVGPVTVATFQKIRSVVVLKRHLVRRPSGLSVSWIIQEMVKEAELNGVFSRRHAHSTRSHH